MPPGHVHLNLWKKYLPLPIVLSFIISFIWDLEAGASFLMGYGVGYYVDPDLDHISITAGEGRILRDFKIFGAIFLAFWFPYSYIFKHRGISHTHILGTLSRWSYAGLVLFILIRPEMAEVSRFFSAVGTLGIYVFLGNCFSDAIHILSDMGWIKITRKDRRK
jgi:uncharacterized metal-binding protein